MSEQNKPAKKYLKGSVKEPSFAHATGDLLNIDLNLEDLQRIVNERGWCRIVIHRRREVDEYGNSHYITENTFVPSKDFKGKKASIPSTTANDPEGDLPF